MRSHGLILRSIKWNTGVGEKVHFLRARMQIETYTHTKKKTDKIENRSNEN